MDNNEDEEIVESLIDDLHTVNLLICILNQLPKGCILRVTDYVDSAFQDGWLLKLKDYMSRDGLFYLFELTSECICYLEKQSPFEQRTLTLEKMNYPYYKYIVTKPIPNVQYGIAAPSFWIGAPGGGVQYKLQYPIDYLINAGYLQIVP